MTNTLTAGGVQRLDSGVKRAFREALRLMQIALECLLQEGRPATPGVDWAWAVFYAVVLRDLGSSALRLSVEGKNTRALLILRRSAFEYRTRFTYYLQRPDQAKLAMDEYNVDMRRFADRLGPNEIRLILDAAFDPREHKSADKPFRNFYEVTKAVFGQHADYAYATFYQYPSFIAHGSASVAADIIEPSGGEGAWNIHIHSQRPFTNEITCNFVVFLLDFVLHANKRFSLGMDNEFLKVAGDFDATRERLGVSILR